MTIKALPEGAELHVTGGWTLVQTYLYLGIQTIHTLHNYAYTVDTMSLTKAHNYVMIP